MEQKQLIITVMKTQSKGKHEVKLHTDIMHTMQEHRGISLQILKETRNPS
jgi:hypothetical protein